MSLIRCLWTMVLLGPSLAGVLLLGAEGPAPSPAPAAEPTSAAPGVLAPKETGASAASPTETPAGAQSGSAAEAPPAAPPPPRPIDQQPYRVLVAVGLAADPEFDTDHAQTILAGLRARIASRLGPLWEAEVEQVPWLGPGRRAVLDSFSEAALNERFLPGEFDKVFLATVEREGPGVRITAREWDRNSQTATAVTSRVTYERRVLVDRLLAEVLLHFRPLAAIERVAEDGVTVELRIRGGELLPPDPSLRPVAEGMFLRPYFRYLDRKKQLRQLQSIPWTYLQTTAVNRGRMEAELTTAFNGVLSGNRRRTELMAIGVKPRFDVTDLQIFPRGQPDNPMAGVRVDLLDRRPTDDDAVTDRQTFYTDRFGRVRLPADPDRPLQFVYVLSGKGVLATVPFIPGDQPQAALDVPDDGPRLLVEGEMAIIEAELIELVARREVTIARALGYARGGKWDQADPLIDEIKRLPTREAVLERIERVRLPAIDVARRTKNRVAISRIDQLCNQVKEHVERHLNPDRVRNFLQEISELKKAG